MNRRTTRLASAAGAVVVALLAGAIAITSQPSGVSDLTDTAPAPVPVPTAEISADAAAALDELEQLVLRDRRGAQVGGELGHVLEEGGQGGRRNLHARRHVAPALPGVGVVVAN